MPWLEFSVVRFALSAIDAEVAVFTYGANILSFCASMLPVFAIVTVARPANVPGATFVMLMIWSHAPSAVVVFWPLSVCCAGRSLMLSAVIALVVPLAEKHVWPPVTASLIVSVPEETELLELAV